MSIQTTHEPARILSKTQMAYDYLHAGIVNGKFQAGAKIVISRVSKQLSISEIPVREALKTLEAEGFVENRIHVGYLVTRLGVAEYREAFSVRQLLGGEAHALAAKNPKPEVLAELRTNIAAMREASEKNDKTLMDQHDQEFHTLVFAQCGNETLLRLLMDIQAQMTRARSLVAMVSFQDAEKTLAEHTAIVNALETGNGELARQLFIAHKARVFNLLIGSL
ncbi:GntR family transcriptional regulator [Desulfovibrio sp. OttesenSCG-928-O18]|nr:GntR family transcriptional regulator [Desulfovibrio sp. OttesenSCG-928-O18]